MKRHTTTLSRLFFVGITILASITTIFSAANVSMDGLHGGINTENIPFDFSDDFYKINGVQSNFIIDRMNGADKISVFDITRNKKFRNVRALLTLPVYGANGEIYYYNPFGDLFREGFTDDAAGSEAQEIANHYPLYVFPSNWIKGTDRQASLIENTDNYFEKNPLGLSVVVNVEYTDGIYAADSDYIERLAKKNGLSLDGTPIIKTVDEIRQLTRMNLVTQRIRGLDGTQPPFAIANVIENPIGEAITQDAFLEYVIDGNTGKALFAEAPFVKNFDCLRLQGGFCSTK